MQIGTDPKSTLTVILVKSPVDVKAVSSSEYPL